MYYKFKIMNTITIKLPLIILFSIIFTSTTHAQKWNFGAHIGLTSTKMLWVDKIEDQPWAYIQYPETQFRQSFSAGLSADYKYNDKFYSPFQLDFYSKRFSISVDGGVVQAFDENGQWIAIRADYLDYRLNQLAFSGGIGYFFIPQLAIEIQPYFHNSISEQQIKVGEVIKWQKDEGFQQDYDFGISGYIRGNFSKFYLKVGYQYGLREITEYSVVDANGAPVGKFPIRNTMFLILMGYQF
jgi:hypothetical protein